MRSAHGSRSRIIAHSPRSQRKPTRAKPSARFIPSLRNKRNNHRRYSAAKSCALSFLRKQRIGPAARRNSVMRLFPLRRAHSSRVRRELLEGELVGGGLARLAESDLVRRDDSVASLGQETNRRLPVGGGEVFPVEQENRVAVLIPRVPRIHDVHVRHSQRFALGSQLVELDRKRVGVRRQLRVESRIGCGGRLYGPETRRDRHSREKQNGRNSRRPEPVSHAHPITSARCEERQEPNQRRIQRGAVSVL